MQTFIAKALVASVTLAGIGLGMTSEAYAVNQFTLGGNVNLDPETGADPGSVLATFTNQQTANQEGAFVGSTGTMPSSLTFFQVGSTNRYSLPSFDVSFTGASNGITTVTVFGPNTAEGDYQRLSTGTTSTMENALNLEATDNNNLKYVGQFVNNGGGGGIGFFGLTFVAVPEPLTLMGASAAIAFGAAFKRRNAKKG